MASRCEQGLQHFKRYKVDLGSYIVEADMKLLPLWREMADQGIPDLVHGLQDWCRHTGDWDMLKVAEERSVLMQLLEQAWGEAMVCAEHVRAAEQELALMQLGYEMHLREMAKQRGGGQGLALPAAVRGAGRAGAGLGGGGGPRSSGSQ